jgi:hypothetical protein
MPDQKALKELKGHQVEETNYLEQKADIEAQMEEENADFEKQKERLEAEELEEVEKEF